jgi:hypothetical protein
MLGKQIELQRYSNEPPPKLFGTGFLSLQLFYFLPTKGGGKNG